MKYQELKQEISKGNFHPVYLLHGDEEFLKKEIVDGITNALAQPMALRTFNFNVQYGKDATTESILNFADMPPVNAQWRVLIIRDGQKLNQHYKKALIPYLENPNPTTCLIFWATERIDERKKFYGAFKKHGVVVNFWPLFDNQVEDWIKSKFRNLGKNGKSQAVRFLHEHLGTNLSAIANEIEKLLIFIGDKKDVTIEDVNKLIGFSKEENVFGLADSIGQRDISTALQTLDRLLINGVNGVFIVSMLTRHFSLLWKAKSIYKKGTTDAQLAKELHQSPRNAKKYYNQSRKFRAIELAQRFEDLYSTDLELKSSPTDQKIIMERLVYNLCK